LAEQFGQFHWSKKPLVRERGWFAMARISLRHFQLSSEAHERVIERIVPIP